MKQGQKCKNCIVKRKGHSEEFDEKKVYASVYFACASAHYDEYDCEFTADSVTKTIKKHIKSKKAISSITLRKKIETELKKKDKELAFYYEQHLPNLKKL
jgi:transcriptional regulator NrdR family protein|tara:strand:- start:447 stop:746 length:300 start_codon:yes stop_codon:yes gene_type:complete